jgi:LacI family transcriptional regulator
MVTIKDVSKASGYSVTTVSKALNNYPDIAKTTKERIIGLCNQMGYVPNSSARSLKTAHSFTIGVVFEENTNKGLQHPVFSQILESFKTKVEKEGYDILFLARKIGNQNGSYLQHSIRKQVEAILVLCADFNTPEMEELYHSELPVVMIDFNINSAITIISDNETGVNQAVDHLVNNGHTQIAHIHGDLESFIGGQRKEFFEKRMRYHSLPLRDDYLANGTYFSKEEGYEAMKKLMTLTDPPTAVFCASDMLAIGAMDAIKEAGKKVPDDFSIIGFDGIDLSQLITPRLTTILQDTEAMGKLAADHLLALIDDSSHNIHQGKTITVDTKLLDGETTRHLSKRK